MKIFTRELTTRNRPLKIHAISTGLVSVKTRFRETPFPNFLAIPSFLLDRRFTEWMPIFCWVIEHPEGIFLIDTGENARVNDPGYFKSSGVFANWLNTTQFKFQVSREEEIGPQLQSIGLEPEAIHTVILTHLHLDHIDGLSYFPTSRILVNRTEWEKPFGDLPRLYPDWLKPELVDLNESYGPFPHAAFLTNSKDLLLLETPGHTHGHASVLLKTDQGHLLFAGDVAYNQNQFLQNKFAGATASFPKLADTYRRIKTFSREHPTVFLPSHDADAGNRLVNLETL